MNVAIFIICRDRVSPLAQLVDWLEHAGHQRLILVDNASTYGPMTEYLRQTAHECVVLGENLGPVASIWGLGLPMTYAKGGYYAVTDADVVPDEQCPRDAVDYFQWALRRYPDFTKVGFGLRIDDLPNHYHLAEEARRWEQKYWWRRFGGDLYYSRIDTTFALYRPDSDFSLGPAIRTGAPYVARHLPWYVDSVHPTEENAYYRDHCRIDLNNWDTDANATTNNTQSQLSLYQQARWRARVLFGIRRDRSAPRRFTSTV